MDQTHRTRTTIARHHRRTAASGSLIRSLSAGTMEGPYSARFPSSPIGETSRRAPAGRRAADERSGCRHDAENGGMAGEPTRRSGVRAPTGHGRARSPICSVRCPPGVLLDATLGGGGHARALLDAHPHLRVVGIDQDDAALAASAPLADAFPGRFTSVRSRFDRIGAIAADAVAGTDEPWSRACCSTSASAHPQLDRADRGFSYRQDAPLDMRMDRSTGPTAADVVNTYDERELAGVLRRFGDERFAGRIARAIVAARPVTTTVELAEIVRDAIPAAARRTGGHPAKRTFQAIRIEVNRELDILPGTLDDAIDGAAPRAVASPSSATTRARIASSRTACARPRPAAAPARPACRACAARWRRSACSSGAAGRRAPPRSPRTRAPRAPACAPPSGSPLPGPVPREPGTGGRRGPDVGPIRSPPLRRAPRAPVDRRSSRYARSSRRRAASPGSSTRCTSATSSVGSAPWPPAALFLSVFGVVIFQTLIVQGQARLDNLNAQRRHRAGAQP